MSVLRSKIAPNSLKEEYLIRAAVLRAFCDPPPEDCLRLFSLSRREWQKLLSWLDISGLALYFLDRIVEQRWCDVTPRWVLARLQENLRDNTERTNGLIAESVAIQREFQRSCLVYAVLKGFSLFPDPVAKLELRHQFDLDFLVAEESVVEARKILEHQGYRLYAISGRSWEFKKNETPGVSVKDLYKNLPGRSVELHVETEAPGCPSLLQRVNQREFHGMTMPVLSPVDLLLGQGMHAYKHICSEYSRTAHLLEFRRHVLLRQDDESFWTEVQARAEGDPRVCLGLGVVTLLITRVMGDFAPAALTRSTVKSLPIAARFWVRQYGYFVVFGSFPGSKLYLLLQRELESSGIQAKRSVRHSLLPRRLPPPVIRPSVDETLRVRIRRYRMQLHFILFRLRFHLVEGLRYIWESHRWRQYMDRHTR